MPSTIRETLRQQAFERVEYYVWAALRCFPVAGGDPITGRPRDGRFSRDPLGHFRAEGREAHKAMARYWLRVARDLR
jgi:hypothetical protein